jgi:hypothetical protein
MIDYADITEENRVLIALDQEKAYNRIKHDYLLASLKTFNLPQTFIKTTKACPQLLHRLLLWLALVPDCQHESTTLLASGGRSSLMRS